MPIKIRSIPTDLPIHHRQFLTDLKSALEELQGSHSPAAVPTNLQITPVAGGNVIKFTRGSNAVTHTVYASNTPNFNDAQPRQIGINAVHNDNVGAPGIHRYYWVRAFDGAGVGSQAVGPIHGRTLPLGTSSVPIAYPPASAITTQDNLTGQAAAATVTVEGNRKL